MRLLSLVIAALIAGCSKEPVVIDGSSADNFQVSVDAARGDLPVADRMSFDAAIRKVPGGRYGMDEREMESLARTTYNGMTAEEVVDLTR